MFLDLVRTPSTSQSCNLRLGVPLPPASKHFCLIKDTSLFLLLIFLFVCLRERLRPGSICLIYTLPSLVGSEEKSTTDSRLPKSRRFPPQLSSVESIFLTCALRYMDASMNFRPVLRRNLLLYVYIYILH